MSCPLCGCEPEDADFRVDMDSNHIKAGGKIFRVEKVLADLAWLMADCYPRVATTDHIIHGLYGGSSDVPDSDIIKVYVARLRKHLQGSGWTIGTAWGRGYRLTKGEWRGLSPSMEALLGLVNGSPQTIKELYIGSVYNSKNGLYSAVCSLEKRGLVRTRKVGNRTMVEAAP